MKKRFAVASVLFFTVILFSVNIFGQQRSPGTDAFLSRFFSPDSSIRMEVILREKIYYRVFYKDEMILKASPLTLTINNKRLGANPQLLNYKTETINENIKTVWGSRSDITDRYNETNLNFAGNYAVKFRIYNEGLAYRFVTDSREQNVRVQGEEVNYRFSDGVKALLLQWEGYESPYGITIMDSLPAERKVFLPMIVHAGKKAKVAITESDLYEYPSLFLKRGNEYETQLQGTFEKYVLTTKPGGFNNYIQLADTRADYLAITSGSRNYPWRVMIISDDDRTFADCDLVYKLARPLQLKDAQWVKPGKVAWDWWHDYALTGVNFNAGINTPTYLYHIDFAAKYGIEYIIVDWKWTDKDDLTLVNPDVDIKKIISYAKSKGVGVILWCPGYTLHRQLNKALDLFAGWGAAGVKADFFERDDQLCIRMYEDMAKATAARKMLIDFHGATKPTGLSRAYPNAINYEGVAGNEWNKLRDIITPEHKAIIPFTRSLAGPMDYTPGGMRNVLSGYSVTQTLPYVRGTRCNEMALYVLYNEPLKMFCDAPTVYEKEPQVIQFLSAIPTTWDETKVLSASIGEYLVTARRTGNTWYIGAITDGQKRSLDVSCSFLKNGNYQAEIFADGDNSDRIGTDYKIEKKSLSQTSMLHLSLNGGGGAVIKITARN